jgi:hypothetical protein
MQTRRTRVVDALKCAGSIVGGVFLVVFVLGAWLGVLVGGVAFGLKPQEHTSIVESQEPYTAVCEFGNDATSGVYVQFQLADGATCSTCYSNWVPAATPSIALEQATNRGWGNGSVVTYTTLPWAVDGGRCYVTPYTDLRVYFGVFWGIFGIVPPWGVLACVASCLDL